MTLTDFMSYADLSSYAEVALVLFLGVFVAITTRTFLPSRSRELYEASLLPLAMDAGFTRCFRWVSLAITLLAFIWPNRMFFTGAWASLRTRALHMDLPIAIAQDAGFVRGAMNTITESGPIYCEGLALLIFALLVGRFL